MTQAGATGKSVLGVRYHYVVHPAERAVLLAVGDQPDGPAQTAAGFAAQELACSYDSARPSYYKCKHINYICADEHYRPEAKKAPKRFSRHYYDVYQMFCSGVLDVAKNDLALLADIVDFTRKFYPRSWAHFEPVMKADYAAMRNMIYGDYPSFDEILSTIKKLETEINSGL